jgi:hypothetical protein
MSLAILRFLLGAGSSPTPFYQRYPCNARFSSRSRSLETVSIVKDRLIQVSYGAANQQLSLTVSLNLKVLELALSALSESFFNACPNRGFRPVRLLTFGSAHAMATSSRLPV